MSRAEPAAGSSYKLIDRRIKEGQYEHRCNTCKRWYQTGSWQVGKEWFSFLGEHVKGAHHLAAIDQLRAEQSGASGGTIETKANPTRISPLRHRGPGTHIEQRRDIEAALLEAEAERKFSTEKIKPDGL